ncbi:MAG: zinc-ribbon domain-containing protein [Gammaproteobacteria bacterium]|nr:zinc-ribbon domain-containing protein [Gammaproteobacteria bacterium]
MSESNQELPIVECPRCHTRFRAREDQLAAAGGRVRCGVCLALFDSGDSRSTGDPVAGPLRVDEPADVPPASPAPSGERSRWRHLLLLWAGMIAVALALVVQVFAYRFDRWASEPQLRSIYEFACGVIGCELPEPSADGPGSDS